MHRIGRTGRSGKTGIATTFINKNQSESILLDLKHLLKEAKQRIPPVLLALHDPMDALEALEAASGKRVRHCIHHGSLLAALVAFLPCNKLLHITAHGRDNRSCDGQRVLSGTPPHVCRVAIRSSLYFMLLTFSWWSVARRHFRQLSPINLLAVHLQLLRTVGETPNTLSFAAGLHVLRRFGAPHHQLPKAGEPEQIAGACQKGLFRRKGWLRCRVLMRHEECMLGLRAHVDALKTPVTLVQRWHAALTCIFCINMPKQFRSGHARSQHA